MSKSRPAWEYALACLVWVVMVWIEDVIMKQYVCNRCLTWFHHEPVYSKKDKRKLIPFCSDKCCKLTEKEVKKWPA